MEKKVKTSDQSWFFLKVIMVCLQDLLTEEAKSVYSCVGFVHSLGVHKRFALKFAFTETQKRRHEKMQRNKIHTYTSRI